LAAIPLRLIPGPLALVPAHLPATDLVKIKVFLHFGC
jgi:hypothetical protein